MWLALDPWTLRNEAQWAPGWAEICWGASVSQYLLPLHPQPGSLTEMQSCQWMEGALESARSTGLRVREIVFLVEGCLISLSLILVICIKGIVMDYGESLITDIVECALSVPLP